MRGLRGTGPTRRRRVLARRRSRGTSSSGRRGALILGAVGLGRGPDAFAVCGLVLLAVGFWCPWLCGGLIPLPVDQQTWMLPWSASQWPVERPTQWSAFWWDGVAQFYPWRLILHRSLRQGELPLWCPSQFCGYPFVGNGQSAQFYPPNWLYALFHPRVGFTLLACLHTALSLVLTYGFCRVLGLSILAAVSAALAYSLGGFMVGWVPLPTATNCATWLPGALLGMEWLSRGSLARGVSVLAMCCGLTVLAGHLQIAAYVLLATILYGLARVASRPLRQSVTTGLGLAVALLVGIGISAPQLLPSLELGGMSPRGSVQATPAGFQGHLAWALKSEELATLLWPEALGSPARGDYPGFAYGERVGYVGVVTLLMAVVGLALNRRRWKWVMALGAGLSLWGAMGGAPAWLLYFGVPGIGLAGGFVRLLMLFTFFTAVLGAMGMEVVESGTARRLRDVARWSKPAAWGLVLLVAADLGAWGWRTIPRGSAARVYSETAPIAYLRAQWRPGDRLLAVTPRSQWSLSSRPRAVMPPNTAAAYEGLESADGYDSLYPVSYRRLASWIEEGADPSPAANGNMVLLENTASPLLALAGVRWAVVAADRGWSAEVWEPAREGEGVCVLRRYDVFPRAFFAEIPPGAGRGELEALARAGSCRITRVEMEPNWSGNKLALFPGPRSRSQTMVVTNTWYPGWQAWLQGKRLEMRPVAGVLQGVSLPAGQRCRVWLCFVPSTVLVGLFVGLSSLALMAGLVVGFRTVRR